MFEEDLLSGLRRLINEFVAINPPKTSDDVALTTFSLKLRIALREVWITEYIRRTVEGARKEAPLELLDAHIEGILFPHLAVLSIEALNVLNEEVMLMVQTVSSR